ncbi:MAG: hypothetical protein FWB80_07565 [Defluviitaleaceae bacterium]|nr:hypothetical protein [Defluviitaleaceae bacterium]
MKKSNRRREAIIRILATSRESARTAREYAELLRIEWRQFTRAVCKLRREGLPICAANTGKCRGYWLPPGGSPDVAAYIVRFERRNKEQDKTLDALKAYQAKNHGGNRGNSETDS